MSKRTTESVVKSSPKWGELEGWLRGSMQKLIQEVLEDVNAKLEVCHFRRFRSVPPSPIYTSTGVSSDVDVSSRCDVSRPA